MNKFSKILCFDGNTMIETGHGSRAIKDVTPGMEVLSYDKNTKKVEKNVVISTAKSRHPQCALITFHDGTSLRATVDHPLLVAEKGWCSVSTKGMAEMYGVSTSQLEVGDVCLRYSEMGLLSSEIISISVEPCSEAFYCLQTSKYHNFFANRIVAHDVEIERFSNKQLISEGVIVEKIK